MKGGIAEEKGGAADLCAGHVVVRRSQPHCGDAPSSRVGFPSLAIMFPGETTCRFAASNVASPNLWPRHLLLFMRWLPRPCATGKPAHEPPKKFRSQPRGAGFRSEPARS